MAIRERPLHVFIKRPPKVAELFPHCDTWK